MHRLDSLPILANLQAFKNSRLHVIHIVLPARSEHVSLRVKYAYHQTLWQIFLNSSSFL
jgi:hypothetical protein